ERVKDKIETLNDQILPEGVKLVSYYDRTWLIHTTLDTVFHNLAEGATLVTLVLFLFLGNVRAAAIVALVIPLALLSTFLGLTCRGIRASLLSRGAMDFGIIVDGAVIVVENVFRRQRGDGSARQGVAAPAGDGEHRRGGAPHLLLDAHHHRGAPADLHAAA